MFLAPILDGVSQGLLMEPHPSNGDDLPCFKHNNLFLIR
jgi:hypothetical protein